MPVQVLIKLFFSLFGLSKYNQLNHLLFSNLYSFISDREMNMTPGNPSALTYLFQVCILLLMLLEVLLAVGVWTLHVGYHSGAH